MRNWGLVAKLYFVIALVAALAARTKEVRAEQTPAPCADCPGQRKPTCCTHTSGSPPYTIVDYYYFSGQ